MPRTLRLQHPWAFDLSLSDLCDALSKQMCKPSAPPVLPGGNVGQNSHGHVPAHQPLSAVHEKGSCILHTPAKWEE